MDDAHYMRLAFDACRAGIDKGQSPFGACIVRDGDVLATAHNTVWLDHDPSAHAEVQAIRRACAELRDVALPGAVMYATTEPCPMCFAAIHWARCGRIVFAARVSDARAAGFNELQIPNETMKRVSGSPIEVTGDFLRDEALELYARWRQRGGRAY